MGIFSEYAPQYWDAGLPVIPLYAWNASVKSKGKRPIHDDWTKFASIMPSEDVRNHWAVFYADSNIGLPFGPASGLCAIDIDTEDPVLIKTITDILPDSPWVRVGQKGMGLVFRWSGQKNFKIQGEDGKMIVEFLGLGNQMVMPPSIHPDTHRPYVANANLWEVLDKIKALDLDIEEQIREAIGARGFKLHAGGRSKPLDVVPAGARDVQMVRHAGYLARVVLGIDKKTQLPLSTAVEHMHHWVAEFTARVPGDEMDPEKGVAKLLEFLLRDLEKGRTLPEGWDADLPEEWKNHPTIQVLQSKNEQARWTVVKAREWLASKIAEKPEDEDWVFARVKDVITMVSDDEQFEESDMRALVPHILRLAAGLQLKKTDLLQMYKGNKREAESEWEDHETIARAMLEHLERDGDIRHDQGRFWQWNGACFEELSEDKIYMTIASNVKGSLLVRRHSDYSSVTKVLAHMTSKPLCEDGATTGVNFANGFLTTGGQFYEHNPMFGATFVLPFNWNPGQSSRANAWFEFLHSIWGHEEDFGDRVLALQEWFAATMFGIAPRFQAAFLLYGRASCGKSVILDVLRQLMPPASMAAIGPHEWSERFKLSGLVGKVLNICGELPENSAIAGHIFKEVIEGTPKNTEFKGVDQFVMTPRAAHWFSTNFLPMSKDSSAGFIRRWRVLDFSRVFAEHEQDKDLADRLVNTEREAIAAWAVEALDRLNKTGVYTTPKCHELRIAQMRRVNNSVQAFLESNGTVVRTGDEDDVVIARDVYDKYTFFMREVSRGAGVGFERFIQMVEDLGVEVYRSRDPMGLSDYMLSGIKVQERKPGL